MHEFKVPPSPRWKSVMERASSRATRVISARFGEVWPQYFVCEFPRSGGTWLARMLSDYLGCCTPGHSIFPIGCRAVIHSHWKYHPKLRRVVFLMRDGRDVMTSWYFYRLRAVRKRLTPDAEAQHRRFEQILGPGYLERPAHESMAAFLRHEFAHPRGANRMTWAQYMRNWIGEDGKARRPNVFRITYRSLVQDTEAALRLIIPHLVEEPIFEHRLRRAVAHYSMKTMTKRAQGEENATSFIRKGVAGDWINHFSREAAEVFNEAAGDMLVAAGFERTRRWLGDYTYADEASREEVPSRV